MSSFKVSELAQEDLLEIYEQIAADNIRAATRLMQTFRKISPVGSVPEHGEGAQ